MTGFENRVPAGWYPDHNMNNTERYWDGNAWTDSVRPVGVGTAYAPLPNPAPQSFEAPTPGPDPFQQPGAPHQPHPPTAKGSSAGKIVLGVIIGFSVLLLGGCVSLVLFARAAVEETGSIIEDGLLEPVEAPDQPVPEDNSVVIGEDQPGELGTTEDPLPYGEETNLRFETFGDADGSVWATTIGAPRDITADVLAANQFNEPPPDGVLFVGFDVTMTLLEADKEPLATAFNFWWELLGGATNAVYDTNTIETASFGCGVVDEAFDGFAEVFEGGTVTGTVCIPLPEEDLGHPDTAVAIHFIDDSRAIFRS